MNNKIMLFFTDACLFEPSIKETKIINLFIALGDFIGRKGGSLSDH